MTAINSNTNALLAQRSLPRAERASSKAMEPLSTGRRINGASDDAAGLAISKGCSRPCALPTTASPWCRWRNAPRVVLST
jgi:hypothetical protein